MGPKAMVRHMDHIRSERGGNGTTIVRRQGDPRGILPLSGNGNAGGIILGEGFIISDVEDAVPIDELGGVKIPYYDAHPAHLDTFILFSEDFAEEVAGGMRHDARDRYACRTFPHQLAPKLKEDLRTQIREKDICTKQQWLDFGAIRKSECPQPKGGGYVVNTLLFNYSSTCSVGNGCFGVGGGICASTVSL